MNEPTEVDLQFFFPLFFSFSRLPLFQKTPSALKDRFDCVIGSSRARER